MRRLIIILAAGALAAPLRAQMPDSADGITAAAPVLHGEQTIVHRLAAFHRREIAAAAIAAHADDPGIRALAATLRQEHADALQGLRGIASDVVDDQAMQRYAMRPEAEPTALRLLAGLDGKQLGPAYLDWVRRDLTEEGYQLRTNLLPGAGRPSLRTLIAGTQDMVHRELNLVRRAAP